MKEQPLRGRWMIIAALLVMVGTLGFARSFVERLVAAAFLFAFGVAGIADLRARNRRNTTIESLKSGGIDNGRRVSLGQLTEIVVPVLGPGMKQCEISGIEKRVGDFVQAGETLVDVAADQVSVSIPASTAGVVFDIPVAVG